MISFLRDALYALFEWPPKSRLEREIWYTERALERYRTRAREIRARPFVCCPHCASGGELSWLEEKIERVEVQLRRLYAARQRPARAAPRPARPSP